MADAPLIALAGPMGAGKTTVGRALAHRLEREFIDLDEQIERRAHKTVAEIFAEDGEVTFRALEKEAAFSLAERRNAVVALGGGAVVDRAILDRFAKRGTVIALRASCETQVARLAADEERNRRPLLVARPLETLRALSALRREAYDRCPLQICVDDESIDEVVRAAERMAGHEAHLFGANGVRRLVVASHGTTASLWIGDGVLTRAPSALASVGIDPGALLVATQAALGPHADKLVAPLQKAGFSVERCDVRDGEQHKNLEAVADLYRACVRAGLSRDRCILSLGGGVVSDLAGFAAATFMRGLAFVTAPTSLLAMVDASVGGKTGFDLPEGKNLVGAFHAPRTVLIDSSTLETLPRVEHDAGMAEVLKHGILAGGALFERIAAGQFGASPDDLEAAVEVKARVVERDPFENGERAHLNLGHTFGHAFERLSGYRMRHGEAVAIGLRAAAALSVRLGLCGRDVGDAVDDALIRLGLPRTFAYGDADQVIEAMAFDKKRKGRSLRFVLLEGLGKPCIVEGPPRTVVREALEGIALANPGAGADT